MAGTIATTKAARAKAAPDADAVTCTPKKRGRAMPRGHKGVYKSTSLVMRHLLKMQRAAELRKQDALGKRERSFVKVLEEAQSTDAAAMPRYCTVDREVFLACRILPQIPPENVPSCDVCALAVNLCAEVARHDGVASVVYDDLLPSRPMSVWTLSCWRM